MILLSITKREKLRHQAQIKLLNLQTFRNQANNKLQKIGSAQQATAKKGVKLKRKVQMQLIQSLKKIIPNKSKKKNLKKNLKKI